MSLMRMEALEAPGVVSRLLAANAKTCAAIAQSQRANPARLVITCARGSSDHAATFAKYLIEQATGVPVASSAPSLSSLYNLKLDVRGALVLAISQSGRSDDLTSFVRDARQSGAQTVAIVNDTTSPLADVAQTILPMHAGAERSIAATKSFIASLAAILQLAGAWSGDKKLSGALESLPQDLSDACAADWSAAIAMLADARSLFVLGRGAALGIAGEAALKLKEVCQIHAEAFSAAEVLHGPLALVCAGFPVLAFLQDDASLPSNLATLERMRAAGARVLAAGSADAGLPTPSRLHPSAALIAMIQSFYLAAEAAARARSLDPDVPRHLRKVTVTR